MAKPDFEERFHEITFVKEDQPRGWWAAILKQIADW
jgi:hypothetical protein